MAKAPSTATGIDIGHHSIKAISLQRKGKDRVTVTGYSNLLVDGEIRTAQELSLYLKQSIKRVGAPSKTIGLAITQPEAIIKNIEQSETPKPILRDALRMNGSAILDQDVTSYVLDTVLNETPAKIEAAEAESASGSRTKRKRQYLVAGLPAATVEMVWNATLKERINPKSLQAAPVSIFNAFQFAQKQTFYNSAFMLVDIGHLETNLIIGAFGELFVVRKVEYGGQGLISYLAADSGMSAEEVIGSLQNDDREVVQRAENYIAGLSREIMNSAGFFENLKDQSISKVLISGGMAASQGLLQALVGFVDIPCELWDPLPPELCERKLPKRQEEAFQADFINLTVAAGVALEQLQVTGSSH